MYKMSDNHFNYDIYPIVIPVGKKTDIHIRPLGGRPEFEPGKAYKTILCALEEGHPMHFPATADFRESMTVCNENGGFTVTAEFKKEEEYFIRFEDENGKRINQFSVYAVEKDLVGRYPFIGDLHMHTNLSDGRQTPEVVAANYRRHGYDFTVISDHRRYYPSLRAINCYKDVPLEFNIVPGEEVHMPPVYGRTNDVHIVNFGGEYSINALTEGASHDEVGDGEEYRSLYGKCPDFMSYEEYQKKMQALADGETVPENVDVIPYTVCKWIFGEIKKANGLGIFAHPTWRANVYHVPEAFTDYLFEKQDFDAFEVLGGENYFEHNGFQTVRYYEERAKGRHFPIVGSTDSHSSYPTNENAYICSTIIFSPENERTALISSVKDFYSVAVDTISKEFRLVGENRFVRYGCFLLKHFFPRHDELCYEEGRLMKQYVTGTDEEKKEAADMLGAVNGRMKKQREKYFAF
ncbi:MAG: hypothetical protein MJ177_08075 [Clostridia bacterium]|nr:hypothetical protein [Clostridia bacterium]